MDFAYKLPKTLDEAEQTTLIESLKEAQLTISPDLVAPSFALSLKLRSALFTALASNQAVRGLEQIKSKLHQEKLGFEKTGQIATRISRLLIFSNDGAERFYRHISQLIGEHAPRIMPLQIDVNQEKLGELLPGKKGPCKALLINDKNAVTHLLRQCRLDG